MSTTLEFYDDSALTLSSGSVFLITHKTDLSDNPQDFLKYLGSNATGTKFVDHASPGSQMYLNIVDKLPDWQALTPYSVGTLVEPSVGNTYVYRCTAAGTSGGSEPTWPTSGIGSTVNDGSVIWELVGKRHQPTEVVLGLSAVELDTNVAGDPIALGTEILSGSANALEIHYRVTNTVTTVQDNTNYGVLALETSEIREQEDI